MTPRNIPFAVGMGYDIHRIATDRALFLGGVEIASDIGLEGHSDADVLLHAICDALLGAAGMGDIGTHFPNTDERWRGADSRDLLRRVRVLIHEAGWHVGNVDATVIAEAPRLTPYVAEMKTRIASDLAIDAARVGIKATTNERLGSVGRGEGIAAMAVALLLKD